MVKWGAHFNIPFDKSSNRFRSASYKSAYWSKRWFPSKGRIFAVVECTSFIRRSGSRKSRPFVTREKVSTDYENVYNHKKIVFMKLFTMAEWAHVHHGGKSNPVMRIVDYIIRYPTFYNKKLRIAKVSFKRDKGRVFVFKNRDFVTGGVKFEPWRDESDYSTLGLHNILRNFESLFNPDKDK